MPEIARFYGIVIKIFFITVEHNPPHFPAQYGESVGVFHMNTLKMIDGDLSQRTQKLVVEWAKVNQPELLDIWYSHKFRKIRPLE